MKVLLLKCTKLISLCACNFLNLVYKKRFRNCYLIKFLSFNVMFSSKSANVLAVLGNVASEALDLTGFYYSGRSNVPKKRVNQLRRPSIGRYLFLKYEEL